MPCSYNSLAVDATLLAEDLKDKKEWGESKKETQARQRASSTGGGASGGACRSNAPNLSIKTAVISTATASNNLMINY